MPTLHKMPTLGVFTADIEKHGIGFTCLDKPHIGANQCGVFLFLLIGPMKMSQTALLGHLTADIEKNGIVITNLEKPHIGANQCGVFFCLGAQGQGCLFPSRRGVLAAFRTILTMHCIGL